MSGKKIDLNFSTCWGTTNFTRVANGDADLGIITPTANLRLATVGAGPFSERYENLVSLGRLLHDDALTCAAAPHVKIQSLAEIAHKKMPLSHSQDLI